MQSVSVWFILFSVSVLCFRWNNLIETACRWSLQLSYQRDAGVSYSGPYAAENLRATSQNLHHIDNVYIKFYSLLWLLLFLHNTDTLFPCWVCNCHLSANLTLLPTERILSHRRYFDLSNIRYIINILCSTFRFS